MKRRGLTVPRLFFLLIAFLSAPVFAGYGSAYNCYATLGEAASRTMYYFNGSGLCGSGQCRILSYVPVSGEVQLIADGYVRSLSVPPCDPVDSVLPSFIQPSPWYGSDPGTVSACGSTVQTNGGISGSGSGSSGPVELLPLSISVADAQNVLVAILMLWAIAWIFKAISRALRVDERDDE
jgi:hypothetical protein